MLNKKQTTLTFAILVCACVVGCSSTAVSDKIRGEYIELQREAEGYRVDGQFVSDDSLSTLPAVLSRFKSKKVIVGSGDVITMGQLLAIGPVLSEAGYEMYITNQDGEPKRANFINGG